ncbi:hypothetical protein KP509_12G076600 [Ceratopteris richardii]|uniref:Phosphoglycerate mutase family protein n=1 Tax=Ceratopteris richardii TaxID=49495 RepID=A0A8T2TTJ8_CERRI|nr:hypothetical protein KP509_12G076600 [Ceratopteris richardii]
MDGLSKLLDSHIMALQSWCLVPACAHEKSLHDGIRCMVGRSYTVLNFPSDDDCVKHVQTSRKHRGAIAFQGLCRVTGTKGGCAVSRDGHARASVTATFKEHADAFDQELEASQRLARRALLACTFVGGITSSLLPLDSLPSPLRSVLGDGAAQASLVQMPPESLNNSYYLVRAGESEFERIGIINTNPVTKTNVESGLSEVGRKQTVRAAIQLRDMGACDGSCWIWPSITQRAYQAAELIAYVNNISRSRIVPEYSFLDARGLGSYEGKDLSYINKVYELDAESPKLRPPPYTDGTPNESVLDVFVRVTQLMSILETQYFAENIIIVSPDSDNLSVLQAALTGLDLRRHSLLAFAPGEVRYVDLGSSSPRKIVRQSGLLKCENPSQCS